MCCRPNAAVLCFGVIALLAASAVPEAAAAAIQTADANTGAERTTGPATLSNDSGALQIERGRVLIEAGEPLRAIPYLQSAVNLDGGDIEARRLLGLAYFRDGQLNPAIEQYEVAIGIAPSDAGLYLALAGIFSASGLTAEAETTLLAAVDAVPGSQRVRYELGDLYTRTGRMAHAIEPFRTAAGLNGDVPLDVVYQRLGNIHTVLAGFDEALEMYRRSLEIDPNSIETRLGLAHMYSRSNRPREAMAELRAIEQRQPNVIAVHYRLAELLLREERFVDAEQAASRAVELDPNHMQSRYLRGMALARMGQHDEAGAELERYRRLETAAQARDRRAAEVASFNGGAVQKLREGRTGEAIELLRRGILAQPAVASLRLSLVLVLTQTNRLQEAAEALEAMIDLGMGVPDTHRRLALLHDRLGNPETAERHRQAYAEATAVAPDSGASVQ